MKAIPLFDTTAPAHAWHDVRAPGGYEQWRFDIQDVASDRHIIARFVTGDPLDANYVRAVEGYRRRPTSTPPPIPQNYPTVEFLLIEKGEVRYHMLERADPGGFSASKSQLDVAIGTSRIMTDADSLRLMIESAAPAAGGETLFVDLTLAPSCRGNEQTFVPFSRATTGGDHRWTIPHAACAVRGVIRLPKQEGAPSANIDFTGRGLLEHSHGTSTLSAVDRCFRGAVMLGGRTIFVSRVRARNPSRPDELHLVEASGGTITDISDCDGCAWDWGKRFPSEIAMSDVVTLRDPVIVQETAMRSLVRYAASSQGETATTLCEIIRPSNRRRWFRGGER